jgi:short-subunit dehydrogenase
MSKETKKKIVITGGSRGLGQALALEFDFQGHEVFIISRDESKLKEVAARGQAITYLAADVSDKNNVYRISGNIAATFGCPDVVIQCASYLGVTPLRLLLDSDCEDIAKVLQTNILAPFRLTKALFGPMAANGGGLFINLSSDAALNNYPNWGAYALSKAAVDRLSGIFDEESKEFNIRHLALDPGDMATDMHFAAIPDADPSQLYDPRDVAREMTRFLLGNFFPESRYTASQWRNLAKDSKGEIHDSIS